MVVILEQKNHKLFMEGKISRVGNLIKNPKGDYSNVNKIGVNKFKNSIKYPPFYVSINIKDKIAQFCLIYGGSSLSVMSKIIMEEICLSCINEKCKEYYLL
jgi:hypothetical protein